MKWEVTYELDCEYSYFCKYIIKEEYRNKHFGYLNSVDLRTLKFFLKMHEHPEKALIFISFSVILLFILF